MPDTIFALATPIGGAVAVIRISGSETKAALSSLFSGKLEPRVLSFGTLHSGDDVIDQCMAVYFPAPKSYTGEDMGEIHIHGGYAVSRRALAALEKAGLRNAEPGEFTRRAFMNGKMDLSRAEAVMDVINASSKRGAESALEQLKGKLYQRITQIENSLIDTLAGIDAAIDYPEELEEDTISALPTQLCKVKDEIDSLIKGGMASRVVREGARIAILGRPNAGKSSLFNALLGEDRAIVTPVEGTTRDILEGELLIHDLPVRLFDTAGLRDAADQAESIGVERARDIIEKADLIIITVDPEAGLTHEERKLLASDRPKLCVVSKSDLTSGAEVLAEVRNLGTEALSVSAVTGEGTDALLLRIADRISPERESSLVTNSRHIAALSNASRAIESAMEAADIDCAATDIRAALISLGEITGSSVDSEVIDRIFATFCVGK